MHWGRLYTGDFSGKATRWRYAERFTTTEGARAFLVDGDVGPDRLHRVLSWVDAC